MFQCKNCGERMIGNGISVPYHCPNAKDEDFDYIAPDEQVVYCKNYDNKENRMENVKYEAVFGPQYLFKLPKTEIIVVGPRGDKTELNIDSMIGNTQDDFLKI